MTSTVTAPEAALDLAQGYTQIFGLPLARTQPYRPSALPSGYIITTAEDMARYMIAMLNETRTKNEHLLQSKTFDQTITPPAGVGSSYGMGWIVAQDEKVGQFWIHGGSLERFLAQVRLIPASKTGMLVLCNQGGLIPMATGFQSLTNGIWGLLIGNEPKPVSLTWIGLLVGAIVAMGLVIQLLRLARLPRSAARASGGQGGVQRTWALIEALLPLALLLVLPSLAGVRLSGSVRWWQEGIDILPDAVTGLLLVLALSLLRGTVKMWILTRQRRPMAATQVPS
jgi:CubicO group peptidase (beta-lactamase class C family)